MDVSEVPEIKRRRKVEYRKVKGRINHRVSNFLNKSVCHEHQQRFNDSKCNNHNRSRQLVSVKDVNAFLDKNRDLAKALQDTKCQVNQLEKEKFLVQIENNKMRAKLNIVTNGILKCACKPSSKTVGILNQVKDSLTQCTGLFTEYMDSLAMEKIGEEYNEQTVIDAVLKIPSDADVSSESLILFDKGVQTQEVATSHADASSQTGLILTRNKKVQVSHYRDRADGHYCCSEEKDNTNKSTQTENDVSVHTQSKNVQCKGQSTFNDNLKVPKKSVRPPLQPLTSNINKSKPSDLTKLQKPRGILKTCGDSKLSFQIYEDSILSSGFCTKANDNKKNETYSKKITIKSPAEVIRYTSGKGMDVVGRNLRSRENRPIYTEVSGNKKLRKGDRGVDVKFYYSPAVKKPRKKKRKTVKNEIPLEYIVSLVQESLLISPIRI